MPLNKYTEWATNLIIKFKTENYSSVTDVAISWAHFQLVNYKKKGYFTGKIYVFYDNNIWKQTKHILSIFPSFIIAQCPVIMYTFNFFIRTSKLFLRLVGLDFLQKMLNFFDFQGILRNCAGNYPFQTTLWRKLDSPNLN